MTLKRLEPSWKTGSMLSQSEGKGHKSTWWNARMGELGETLVGEIMESQGFSREDAKALVDEHFIGVRQSAKGQVTLAASPAAQELLLEKKSPPLKGGWKTGNMLKQNEGGDSAKWNKHMVALREECISSMVKNRKMPLEEAKTFVNENFIGPRQPRNSSIAMAASPGAQRLLLEKYVVERRAKKDEPAPSR